MMRTQATECAKDAEVGNGLPGGIMENHLTQCRLVFIQRSERYSPNSVDKDAAILRAVAEKMAQQQGNEILVVSEDEQPFPSADVYISMGRHPATLQYLTQQQQQGRLVINKPEAVHLCCHRMMLGEVLKLAGVGVAPEEGSYGYWLKRADGVAEKQGDVRYVPNRQACIDMQRQMKQQGMKQVQVSAHVPGDVVKFYGVRGTPFFFHCYPNDDGNTKFGDERQNGVTHHYPFSVEELHSVAAKAARAVDIDVYGGDCIVRADGSFVIIDFNDWPSFSRCCMQAAEAIAQCIKKWME